ncbi:MAG: hypothetical protein HY703_05645 [Gemmatimonadetes bacterium]|nr:hypothetical protein [Gemmatimonadota bacterium]
MRNPFASRGLSEPTRRRIELAVAVAQERLLGTHVDHALALIQLVGARVPFEDALDIYTRMLRLSDEEARVITTRALAILGERAGGAAGWPEPASGPHRGGGERGGTRSFLENLRQRLRGRVNEELRRWIEIDAARTEVALLETHVDNALKFVELLEKEAPFDEAVDLYLDALDVRDSVGEVVYYYALSRLGPRFLPQAEPKAAQARAETIRLKPAEERRLRVVESEGA